MKPCRNCPHKDGCEIKAEKQRALRGLGLTLVNFKCDKRLSLLQPGQRIKLTLATEWQGEHGYGTTEFEAVVMRPTGTRILVWLLDRGDGKNPIAVHPDRVTPIEGMVKLCPACQQPEGTNPSSGFWCVECNPELAESTT